MLKRMIKRKTGLMRGRGQLKSVLLYGFVLAFLLFEGGGAAWARPLILIYGDSLSAGYGLSVHEGFAPQLARALEERAWDVDLKNASLSGETTQGGLSRLSWTLDDLPSDVPLIAILELGANDALRGQSPTEAEKNLDAMITQMKARGMEPLLAGMRAPRNLGKRYRDSFDAIYSRLAEKHDILLYPFFLEGVALKPSLNLYDRIHPNAKGIARIVEGILPYVEKTLRRASGEKEKDESGWFW